MATGGARDGLYFLNAMKEKRKYLHNLCARGESELNGSRGTDVEGKWRAAIGHATLLTTKKFGQFQKLCETCIQADPTNPYPVKVTDLEGFWDMVRFQVEDVREMFETVNITGNNGNSSRK